MNLTCYYGIHMVRLLSVFDKSISSVVVQKYVPKTASSIVVQLFTLCTSSDYSWKSFIIEEYQVTWSWDYMNRYGIVIKMLDYTFYWQHYVSLMVIVMGKVQMNKLDQGIIRNLWLRYYILKNIYNLAWSVL